MPDIFDEVDEDLRAERAQNLLRRYGGLLIFAMLLTLAGVGAYHVWADRQRAEADAVATKFLAAQKAADGHTPRKDVAAQFADIAATAPEGYKVLAKLQLASLQWDSGKHDEAIAAWTALANDTATPPLLRDLSTLLRVQHQLDSADPVQLKQQLNPMVLDSASRWRPIAMQLTALLDLRLGRAKEARELFRQLMLDPQAPQGVRQVAQAVLAGMMQDDASSQPTTASKAGTHG